MSDEHGIIYDVEQVKVTAISLESLEEHGVSYVHIYWVDIGNTRHNRVLPLEYFLQLMKSNRPGVNLAAVGLALVYLNVPEGFSGVGECLYAIDISTLRILHGVGPDGGSVAAVLGRLEHKDPALSGGKELNIDPRTTLSKFVETAKVQHKTDFLIGFESEFILLRSTRPVMPSNVHSWSATAGLLAGSLEAKILHEIAEALKRSGIPLQLYHAEAAPGQYEVSTSPMTPLEAVDALVYTREIIVNIAAKHGLHATFAPRPFLSSAGSSVHANVSIHAEGEKKKPSQLTGAESSWLAGVLNHLPAISAFALPTYGSYKRVGDGVWSGGTYVSYGSENREAPIRLVSPASPGSRRFELRCIDGTANPYYAVAAVLAAGINGISNKEPLTTKDCRDVPAATMSEERRKEMGVFKRMPLTIEQAREFLQGDAKLTELLGEDFVRNYLAVNKTLGEALLQDSDPANQLSRLVEYY